MPGPIPLQVTLLLTLVSLQDCQFTCAASLPKSTGHLASWDYVNLVSSRKDFSTRGRPGLTAGCHAWAAAAGTAAAWADATRFTA